MNWPRGGHIHSGNCSSEPSPKGLAGIRAECKAPCPGCLSDKHGVDGARRRGCHGVETRRDQRVERHIGIAPIRSCTDGRRQRTRLEIIEQETRSPIVLHANAALLGLLPRSQVPGGSPCEHYGGSTFNRSGNQLTPSLLSCEPSGPPRPLFKPRFATYFKLIGDSAY
jgi:hypothetical protein